MNRAFFVVGTVIVSFGLASAPVTLAQPGPGRTPGQGRRLYDRATVETVTGVVQRVDRVPSSGGGKGYGIHLLLKTDKEEIAVRLGPSWYLDQQSLKVAAQDRIEVRGSRVTDGGAPALIAAEIKKGDQVLRLRDANGVPLWRGQGRRGS